MSEKISTEVGNNEIQLVEFKVGDGNFGINIEKVSKIIPYVEPTKYPKAPHEVLGMMDYRDNVIPVISLFKSLNIEPINDDRMIIITHFNKMTISFVVGEIIGILRSTWDQLESTEKIMSNVKTDNSTITSVLKEKGRLISMVDFENIYSGISEDPLDIEVSDLSKVIETDKEIIFAEDSNMMSTILKDNLKTIGFSKIKDFSDGRGAWEYLKNKEQIDDVFCLISDIEMPKMDGLTLSKKVKEDPLLKKLKVLLFSSLIKDSVRIKAEKIGVDAQITKPDLKELMQILNSIQEGE